jgi:hypothetical protein
LFFTLEVTSCVRDTDASIHFSKTHPFKQTYVNTNNRETLQIISSVQLFIKLLFRYLEHLDSVGLRHAPH